MASVPAALAFAILVALPSCGGEEACARSFDGQAREDDVCTPELPVCVLTTIEGSFVEETEARCGICETDFSEGGYKACPKGNPTCLRDGDRGGQCCGGNTACP